jgi:hypothetical protein
MAALGAAIGIQRQSSFPFRDISHYVYCIDRAEIICKMPALAMGQFEKHIPQRLKPALILRVFRRATHPLGGFPGRALVIKPFSVEFSRSLRRVKLPCFKMLLRFELTHYLFPALICCPRIALLHEHEQGGIVVFPAQGEFDYCAAAAEWREGIFQVFNRG